MNEIINKIIDLDKNAKRKIDDIKQKEEAIEEYIEKEVEERKAKIDEIYLYKKRIIKENYDRKYLEKTKEIDEIKNSKISLLVEEYQNYKNKILTNLLQNII